MGQLGEDSGMTTHVRSMARFWPLSLALGVPVLLMLWLTIPGLGPRSALLGRWQTEMDTISVEALPARMQQIADLGDAGLPLLAASLYSPRDEVSDAAQDALAAQLARWQKLASRESS